MSVEIRDSHMNVIATSHNLRGLRAKTGKDVVDGVLIRPLPEGEGELQVLFANGDNCTTNFADYDVLKWSLRNWRNLYSATLYVDGKESGEVRRDNPALQ
jgi:hypothetical protein